jgi:ribosomal protein S18 acetylase RimI-like enzyme
LRDGSDVKWAYSGCPALNYVFGATTTSDQADSLVMQVLQRCLTWKQAVLWLIGPSTRPLNLNRFLERQGFQYKTEWTGMALDLDAAKLPSAMPNGFTVEAVDTFPRLRMWARTWTHDLSPETASAAAEVFVDLGFGPHLPWRQYIGRLCGRPVATCALFVHEQSAGIYWVKVLPPQRRCGLGTALCADVLRQAAARGYTEVVLQSTPMAVSLYRNLGFLECCRIGVHVWTPPDGASSHVSTTNVVAPRNS